MTATITPITELAFRRIERLRALMRARRQLPHDRDPDFTWALECELAKAEKHGARLVYRQIRGV